MPCSLPLILPKLYDAPTASLPLCIAYLYASTADVQDVQREAAGKWIIVQGKRPARNLVELFDFINGVEDFRAVHCFDVINGAL